MLTSRVAQRIADEVMSGLGYNINVMDNHGIIIGSGTNSRIGSFHETAKRVLEQDTTIMVSENEAVDLRGVLPGINMPIRSNGAIVGVVGITGNPDEVKNVARLVRTAAELIVEQEENTYRLYMHRSDKNAFVLSLLNESASGGFKGVATWAQELGYDMRSPRVACLIDWPCSDAAPNIENQEKRLSSIKDSPRHLRQDISVSMGANVLVFKTISDTSAPSIEREITEYINGVRERAGASDAEGLRCSVGCYHSGLEGYGASYSDAVKLQSARAQNETVLFAHRNLSMQYFDMLSSDFRKNVLGPYIVALRGEFGDGLAEAADTMRILLSNGFHYDDAASRLYVHKNTIAFRRKKVEACLGFDPRDRSDDQLLLMLILKELQSSEA